MSFFQKNISALLLRTPQAAQYLSGIAPGKIEPLSTFHPAQFQTRLHQLKQKQVKQMLLIGMGSGNALQHILSVLNPLNLVVIEPEPQRLAAVFHHQDLTPFIQNPNVFFVLGNTIQNIQHGLLSVKTSLAAHGYHQLVNPEVYDETSAEVQFVSQSAQIIIQEETLFLRMRLARADMCQLNIIQNMPAIFTSYSLDELMNLCGNMPTLIIAAGPSLDQSIADIQQIKDRVLLIAVDTALRTLLKHGIHPHIVVTTDPTRDNSKHFDGVDLPSNTLLAFAQDCHYAILQQFADHPNKVALLDDSACLTYWLQSRLGFHTVFRRSLNVSEAAVRFALHVGCTSILFTGLDLAIPVLGGKTHTADASHSYSIKEKRENQILIQKQDGTEEWLPVVQVDGWNDETVYTYPSFKMYLHELEQIIAQHSIQWIDCTISGAKKQGCQRMTLLDAVGQHGKSISEIQNSHTNIVGIKKYNIEPCIQALKDGIKLLKSHQNQFIAIKTANIDIVESGKMWNCFLQDQTVRALLYHAVFRFQLYEPLNRIAQSKKQETLQHYANEAAKVIQQYIPLLNHAAQQLNADA